MKKHLRHIAFILSSSVPWIATAQELSIFGDLLVWHASQQTGATWAQIVTQPTPTQTNFAEPNAAFDWHSGFRAGFLYQPTCDFWDSKLYWTYFSTKTGSLFPVSDQLMVSEFFSGNVFFSGDAFFGSDLSWRLVMNNLDYEASHSFDIGDCFTLRPSIGIKAATINQAVSITWDAIIYQSEEKLKNNFFGIGPTFGIDGKWHIYKGLSLFGDLSTAFLWGNWKLNDTYSRPAGLLPAKTVTTHMTNLKLGTVMFDYFLGFEWIHEGRSCVTVQLGYEMQYWPNQLRLPTFQQLPLHSDLTLQGGTCRIIVDL